MAPCSTWHMIGDIDHRYMITGDMFKFTNVTTSDPCIDYDINLIFNRRGKLAIDLSQDPKYIQSKCNVAKH